MFSQNAMKKKEKNKYTVRIVFEGGDMEILLRVMAHYRYSNAKDLIVNMLKHSFQEIKEKEKEEENE